MILSRDMLPILLVCCPIPCISSHIQVVPTPSKYQDRIHLKCTWLCYVRYLSGRRWRWVNPRNRGVFDVKLSVHLSSGLRGAATANHREDMSSFCRLWRVWLTSGLCRWRWLYSLYTVTITCALTYSAFLWYPGVKRQQFIMVRWQHDFAEGWIERQSIEIEQDISLSNVLVILPVPVL